jgi:hypothetical protein
MGRGVEDGIEKHEKVVVSSFGIGVVGCGGCRSIYSGSSHDSFFIGCFLLLSKKLNQNV